MEKRGLRTKKALAEAAMELLEKRDFSKITVNDICICAAVSRSTFYAHFVDKYALSGFCLKLLGEQMTKALTGKGHQEVVEGIIDTLQAHKQALRNLLLGGGDKEIELMLHQAFSEDCRVYLEAEVEKTGADIPISMLAGFIGAGCTYILMTWLRDGLPYSREEMVYYLMELTKSS